MSADGSGRGRGGGGGGGGGSDYNGGGGGYGEGLEGVAEHRRLFLDFMEWNGGEYAQQVERMVVEGRNRLMIALDDLRF